MGFILFSPVTDHKLQHQITTSTFGTKQSHIHQISITSRNPIVNHTFSLFFSFSSSMIKNRTFIERLVFLYLHNLASLKNTV